MTRRLGIILGLALAATTPMVAVAGNGQINGRVVDTDGEPLAEAGVRFHMTGDRQGYRGRPLWTPEDGRFTLDVPAGRIRLKVYRKGYQDLERELEVAAGETLDDIEIRLVAGIVIRGRLSRTDDTPVDGARIHARHDRASHSTETGDDGSYSFSGLAPGTYRVGVKGRPLSETRLLEARPGETEAGAYVVDLRLPAGHPVSGQVVDEDGTPVAGALLTLHVAPKGDKRGTTGQRLYLGKESRSAVDGTFELSGVPSGTWELSVRRDGLAIAESSLAVDGGPVYDLLVRMSRGATVHGQILGLAAEELSRLEISAKELGKTFARKLPGEVDANGKYAVPHLTPGDWRVIAALDERRVRASFKVHHSEVSSHDADVHRDLEFSPASTLNGRVVLTSLAAGTWRPLAGAAISAQADGSDWARATSDGEGRFRFEHLPSGPVELQVALLLFNYERRVEHGVGDEAMIEIVTSHLSGTVRDGTGLVDGAEVIVLPLPSAPRTFHYSGRPILTDAGRFSLDVPAQRVIVAVRKSGFIESRTEVDLRHSAIDVDLEIQAGVEP